MGCGGASFNRPNLVSNSGIFHLQSCCVEAIKAEVDILVSILSCYTNLLIQWLFLCLYGNSSDNETNNLLKFILT